MPIFSRVSVGFRRFGGERTPLGRPIGRTFATKIAKTYARGPSRWALLQPGG
jgi:hypothetical protein